MNSSKIAPENHDLPFAKELILDQARVLYWRWPEVGDGVFAL